MSRYDDVNRRRTHDQKLSDALDEMEKAVDREVSRRAVLDNLPRDGGARPKEKRQPRNSYDPSPRRPSYRGVRGR